MKQLRRNTAKEYNRSFSKTYATLLSNLAGFRFQICTSNDSTPPSRQIYSIQKAVANIYKRLTYDNVEWDDQINFNKLRSGPTRPPR